MLVNILANAVWVFFFIWERCTEDGLPAEPWGYFAIFGSWMETINIMQPKNEYISSCCSSSKSIIVYDKKLNRSNRIGQFKPITFSSPVFMEGIFYFIFCFEKENIWEYNYFCYKIGAQISLLIQKQNFFITNSCLFKCTVLCISKLLFVWASAPKENAFHMFTFEVFTHEAYVALKVGHVKF